ncbi:unnamed protein product [Schistocephalus solidus]|uniref:Secreted protein n=1 Tax=Schistocephalus solidus TaxID=70667 RepID=A0A183SMU0_SCHSO|nr:unnamed protein product [Schistocephalus solidus]
MQLSHMTSSGCSSQQSFPNTAFLLLGKVCLLSPLTHSAIVDDTLSAEELFVGEVGGRANCCAPPEVEIQTSSFTSFLQGISGGTRESVNSRIPSKGGVKEDNCS